MVDPAEIRLLPLTARSRLDPRDYLYRTAPPPNVLAAITAGQLPSEVDLHALGLMPDPWDQASEGSCTGHSEAEAMVHAYMRAKQAPPERFSPRYVYWRERVIEGTTGQDAGAEPRDGLDQLVKVGVCVESKCPYVAGDFAVAPSAGADADAALHLASRYEALPGWQWICQALGGDQRFVMAAGPWFNEWFNPAGGVLPLVPKTENPAGGHAYGFCGYRYDGTVLRLKLHNSWGLSAGDGTGHYWIEADKVDDYLWERWVVYAAVENQPAPDPTPDPQPQSCQAAALSICDQVIEGFKAGVEANSRSTKARYLLQGAQAVRYPLSGLPS